MSRSEERHAARRIVRWTEDLDKSILLFINYACSEAGIRIPFGRVAELMGPRFSEGAIIQHIAKIRNKMQEEKEKSNPGLLVPPPNKRGSVTKASSTGYPNPRQRKSSAFSDPIYESKIKLQNGKAKRGAEEGDDHRDPDYKFPSGEKTPVKKCKSIPGNQRPGLLRLRCNGLKKLGLEKPGADDDPDYDPGDDDADDSSNDVYSPRSTPMMPRQRMGINYTNAADGDNVNEEIGTKDNIDGETRKFSRIGQHPAQMPSSPAPEFSSSEFNMPENFSFQTPTTMRSATPNGAQDTRMLSPANGVGRVGKLDVIPHRYGVGMFTDANFIAMSSNTATNEPTYPQTYRTPHPPGTHAISRYSLAPPSWTPIQAPPPLPESPTPAGRAPVAIPRPGSPRTGNYSLAPSSWTPMQAPSPHESPTPSRQAPVAAPKSSPARTGSFAIAAPSAPATPAQLGPVASPTHNPTDTSNYIPRYEDFPLPGLIDLNDVEQFVEETRAIFNWDGFLANNDAA